MTALVDTGATASFIRSSTLDKLLIYEDVKVSPLRFTAGNGLPIKVSKVIQTSIDLRGDKTQYSGRFLASEELPFEIILGTDILESMGAVIDVRKGTLKTSSTLRH